MFVVDSNRAPQQLDAVEIIDGQDGAPLVLVLDEAEPLGARDGAEIRYSGYESRDGGGVKKSRYRR